MKIVYLDVTLRLLTTLMEVEQLQAVVNGFDYRSVGGIAYLIKEFDDVK